jgi:hypothetical protein
MCNNLLQAHWHQQRLPDRQALHPGEAHWQGGGAAPSDQQPQLQRKRGGEAKDSWLARLLLLLLVGLK